MTGRTLCILQAEDSLDDALLTKLALKEGRASVELHQVRDGMEALEFLRHQGSHADAPRPDLVLLDLNMPRLNGHETLDAIKTDPDLRGIPVIVLTTSGSPHDVSRCYDHYVNSYVRKPIDYDQFVGVMRSIQEFWLGAAILPSAR
jgi:chemotaxis family two-component system response regulator Rcp1